MPRVSQDYLEAQRTEILQGARRCFAGYGYEEATVVRLEEATGRSRGAIFHHFPTKLDLFLAVLERDAEREAARWEAGSVADVLTGLAAEDPDWATVVIEQSRRRPHHRPALIRGLGAGQPHSDPPSSALRRVVVPTG
jgi:AcrR family transcriptional regulator